MLRMAPVEMTVWGLFVVLFLAAAPASADNEQRLKACLGNNPSNAGMIGCTSDALESEDTRLNKLWEQVKAAVRAHNAKQPEGQRHNWDWLLDAQRGWLQYRENQCKFHSEEMHGGSGAALLHVGCMYDMTRARNEELLEHLKYYTGGN